MTSLSTPRTGFKNDFSMIADSFLHSPVCPSPPCWTPNRSSGSSAKKRRSSGRRISSLPRLSCGHFSPRRCGTAKGSPARPPWPTSRRICCRPVSAALRRHGRLLPRPGEAEADGVAASGPRVRRATGGPGRSDPGCGTACTPNSSMASPSPCPTRRRTKRRSRRSAPSVRAWACPSRGPVPCCRWPPPVSATWPSGRTKARRPAKTRCSAALLDTFEAERRGRLRPVLLLVHDAGPAVAAGTARVHAAAPVPAERLSAGPPAGPGDHLITWTRPEKPRVDVPGTV